MGRHVNKITMATTLKRYDIIFRTALTSSLFFTYVPTVKTDVITDMINEIHVIRKVSLTSLTYCGVIFKKRSAFGIKIIPANAIIALKTAFAAITELRYSVAFCELPLFISIDIKRPATELKTIVKTEKYDVISVEMLTYPTASVPKLEMIFGIIKKLIEN